MHNRRTQILLSLLLSILMGCGRNSQFNYRGEEGLPFTLTSKEVIVLTNPVFAFDLSPSDSECRLSVCDQNDTTVLYPIDYGYSFFIQNVPYISQVVSYNDSIAYFKINRLFSSLSFEKKFKWQESSLSPFILSDAFDDIEYCTDRYYKRFLSIKMSDYERLKMIRFISRSNLDDIDESWKSLLPVKDPSAWQDIIYFHENKREFYGSTSFKDMLLSIIRHLSDVPSYMCKDTKNDCPVNLNRDLTSSSLQWDSVYVFVLNNDNRQFLFSSELVSKQQTYPLFKNGFNCYAIELESDTDIMTISERIYQNEYGEIYRLSDSYNPKVYPICMKFHSIRNEYSLCTSIHQGMKEQIFCGYPSYESPLDSTFIKGNQLVFEWLNSR